MNKAATFDPLQAFADWWSGNGNIVYGPPVDSITRFGPVSVLTLYRDEEFQVQLAICDPNSEITDHSHPGVELIKVYVGGEIYLRVNGKQRVTPEMLQANEGRLNGVSLRLGPNDVHGAKIGPKGGAFLTIQRHSSGTRPLGLCWKGEPLDGEHARRLREAAR